MKLTRSVFALAVCASAGIYAQIPVPPPGEGMLIAGDMVKYVSAEFGPDGKQVKGAPYSAQANVTTTQTLADGNRIVNKSSSFLARDSEGRTRREQTIKSVGPWATGQSPVAMVFINDPQAQVSYMLDPRAHTARKSPNGKLEAAAIEKMKAEAAATGYQGVKIITGNALAVSTMRSMAETKVMAEQADKANMVMESLGTKAIEGVQAEGKRFTRTVPAGEIGNERPLVFVNEVWTSPELHAVVMSRHVDPQAGETVYTLTNIQLAEPDPALFSVPADYTVTDAPKSSFVMERRER